ncbi:Aldo/keto reductase-like protein [Fragilaria crotonensis]|nr:Aldo/keto reductase-like protein [Fragilaria crotonensis]
MLTLMLQWRNVDASEVGNLVYPCQGRHKTKCYRSLWTLKPKEKISHFLTQYNAHYNVLEQRPGAALLEAHERGMDIIIKEGLANGRALRHSSVIAYSQKLNCEPDHLALGCILAQPFNPRVLSGALTADHLESNWKAVSVADKLRSDPALLKEIMDSCVVPSEEYWDERSALKWN